MRGLGLFFGSNKRNEPVGLDDPHPVARFDNAVHTGSPAHDGYTRLSIADPTRQGSPPPAPGTGAPCYQGPDQSFEQ
jgi:hypothetical protein